MWWWYDCYTHTSNVRLSRSWGSWASYFFSILILLEILTLPLHHHFLLASQPPYLPPPTVSHTHTHARRQAHAQIHTCTRCTLICSFTLPLFPPLTHLHTAHRQKCVRKGYYWSSTDGKNVRGKDRWRDEGVKEGDWIGRGERDDKCLWMQLSMCVCVGWRESWLAFQVWCVWAGMRAHSTRASFLLFLFLRFAALCVQRQQSCRDKRWKAAWMLVR